MHSKMCKYVTEELKSRQGYVRNIYFMISALQHSGPEFLFQYLTLDTKAAFGSDSDTLGRSRAIKIQSCEGKKKRLEEMLKWHQIAQSSPKWQVMFQLVAKPAHLKVDRLSDPVFLPGFQFCLCSSF